jgi:hypothetical protein
VEFFQGTLTTGANTKKEAAIPKRTISTTAVLRLIAIVDCSGWIYAYLPERPGNVY